MKRLLLFVFLLGTHGVHAQTASAQKMTFAERSVTYFAIHEAARTAAEKHFVVSYVDNDVREFDLIFRAGSPPVECRVRSQIHKHLPAPYVFATDLVLEPDAVLGTLPTAAQRQTCAAVSSRFFSATRKELNLLLAKKRIVYVMCDSKSVRRDVTRWVESTKLWSLTEETVGAEAFLVIERKANRFNINFYSMPSLLSLLAESDTDLSLGLKRLRAVVEKARKSTEDLSKGQ